MIENVYYPTTLLEAIRYYSDLDIATKAFAAMRWPNGVTCPYCRSKENYYAPSRRIWKCKECKKQFSPKAGTVCEESPIGFDKWMTAIWLICNAKNGISSMELHRSIGVTQKTAWFMLHRIRNAMQTGTFEKKATGRVEVDETFIGGKSRNMHKHVREQKITALAAKTKSLSWAFWNVVEKSEHKSWITGRRNEIALNSVESRRPSELIGYATLTPFATGLLTAFAIEDSSAGIWR